MLTPLWIIYFVLYIIFSSPFAEFTLVYFTGMILPGVLYPLWKIFEAAQAGGGFSVYYRVMGRFYFQVWSWMLLPCAVMANFGDEWLWIALGCMVTVPSIIWFWMYQWMSIGTMLTDKSEYDAYRRYGRDPWTTDNELNWEERNQ